VAITVLKMTLWAFNAFWLWIGLALVLRKAGLPFAVACAALLGWIGSGLSLPWILPGVVHWLSSASGVTRHFLTMP
jgi:hypothetical protein